MRTLVAYVPVMHEGYRRFFEGHRGDRLFLVGEEFVEEVPVYRKDIRRLPAAFMQRFCESLNLFSSVEILTKENVAELDGAELVLPDEEPLHILAEQYLSGSHHTFENVFLMWDKRNALAERPQDAAERVTADEMHRRLLSNAETEAEKSVDMWRRVGAVLARDRNVLLAAHNQHLPSDHTLSENGDPRNGFHKGEFLEMSSSIHAEAAVIAEAAKRGISTDGADMYVTVFPCPPCAKLIAQSGIKNLYCGGGYGVLDGEEILKAAGVKIFFVET